MYALYINPTHKRGNLLREKSDNVFFFEKITILQYLQIKPNKSQHGN
jgi:hypothetical protein